MAVKYLIKSVLIKVRKSNCLSDFRSEFGDYFSYIRGFSVAYSWSLNLDLDSRPVIARGPPLTLLITCPPPIKNTADFKLFCRIKNQE